MNAIRKYLTISWIILAVLAISTGITTAQRGQDDGSNDVFKDIEPYEGSVGPGSALYGLKIALQSMREGLTFNEKQKLEIQVEHAKERIAEARAELRNRNDDAANRALDRYREKIRSLDDRVTGIDMNDTGLIEIQKSAMNQQIVLERLADDHPGNPGLRTAFEDNMKLQDKLELKTNRQLVPVISRERIVLREVVRDRIHEIQREGTQVEAKIVGNDTQVRVRVKFVSNRTERNAIAAEMLNKIQLSRDDISGLLEIEVVDFEELRERLEARAKIMRSISEDEVEFRFPLNGTTNRTDIIDRTASKLSTLTVDRIRSALEIDIGRRIGIEEINENERIEIRAKVAANATQVRVRLEFISNNTDPGAIAQEILGKIQLSREAIDNLLEIEQVQNVELRERLKAKINIGRMREIREGDRGRAGRGRGDDRGDDRRDDGRDMRGQIGVGNDFSEVEFELEFPLNATSRADIVGGIFQKLSGLTVRDVMNELQQARIEIRQKIEDRRREIEIRREAEDRHEAEPGRGGESEAERGGGGRGGSSGGGRGKK